MQKNNLRLFSKNNSIALESAPQQNLTDIQLDHLNSKMVRLLIAEGKLTSELAIKRTAPHMLKDLNEEMIQGIRIGLERSQVKNDWFSSAHIEAICNHGMNYEDLINLTYPQVKALFIGLNQEQVQNDWFQIEHFNAIKSGELTYNQIKELEGIKVIGMQKLGLDRSQVDNDWFALSHFEAMNDFHLPYDQIMGLKPIQVDGMMLGLSRSQVNNDWFSWPHWKAIKDKVLTYQEIAGLHYQEVYGLLNNTFKATANESNKSIQFKDKNLSTKFEPACMLTVEQIDALIELSKEGLTESHLQQ